MRQTGSARTLVRYRDGVRRRALAAWHRGAAVECPCCGSRFRRFKPFGQRPNIVCWRCGAHDRHRALWLYLERRTDIFAAPHDVLHFSPEYVLRRRLERAPNLRYVTSDLEPGCDLRLDITAMALDEASFDVILCIHVLEHVPEDRRALAELRRVLRPGGWAIVLVPLDPSLAETYEDPAVTTPEQRQAAYWQADHLRLYGRDFSDRLREAGLDVRVDHFVQELGSAAIARYGLHPGEDIYVCSR